MVIREANSVQWWVCGDCRQGISCVLPALTCWVELCADHTGIGALGTVGSAAHAHYTNLKHVYRPCFYNDHKVFNGVQLLQLLHVL